MSPKAGALAGLGGEQLKLGSEILEAIGIGIGPLPFLGEGDGMGMGWDGIGWMDWMVIIGQCSSKIADFPAVFFKLCHGTQMKIQVQIN